MRALFLLSLLVGFGGTLVAAHWVPWVGHQRLAAQTSVVLNGGRAEQFMIRLPADRIAATDGKAGGIRSVVPNGPMLLPAKFVGEPLLIEHFKVRDADDKVIGIAARHWGDTERGLMTTWSVLIPSRGALLLRAPGEARGALRQDERSGDPERRGHPGRLPPPRRRDRPQDARRDPERLGLRLLEPAELATAVQESL